MELKFDIVKSCYVKEDDLSILTCINLPDAKYSGSFSRDPGRFNLYLSDNDKYIKDIKLVAESSDGVFNVFLVKNQDFTDNPLEIALDLKIADVSLVQNSKYLHGMSINQIEIDKHLDLVYVTCISVSTIKYYTSTIFTNILSRLVKRYQILFFEFTSYDEKVFIILKDDKYRENQYSIKLYVNKQLELARSYKSFTSSIDIVIIDLIIKSIETYIQNDSSRSTI